MKKQLLVLIFSTFSSLVIGQVNNANDFLRFSKKTDNLKKTELGLKRWNIVQPETLTTQNGITTETSIYSKNIDGHQFLLKLEKSLSEQSNIVAYKSTIEIPDGTTFDNWTDEIENIGYNFVSVKNQKGRLVTGEKNFMIIADLLNIDQHSNNWKYEYSTLTSSTREKSDYPVSQQELNQLKMEYNSSSFAKTPKVWVDEYYSSGLDDPNIKFSSKWTENNFYTGIFHFKGKFCSYYGKDNIAIVWSGNMGAPKFEGLIEWTNEKPIKKGESMVQINLYTNTGNYNFDTLILNME